ncbi:hypothetical protein KY290_020167 [Solanum tuberosum]|uniref:ABC transporter domain-containing protein n=1 Tax=Solanum tuberosum TaxID=4113 RepID=A0ABQ7VKI5_SOLTU|nr:hypothetical protein KY289_019348 [Solanum tuberosum]KAH0764094.1 hypothetical protein KY290_020167 [Solanum tuberosum]
MEVQRGFLLLKQQYKALIKKNYLVAWRNKMATFLQLFASLFFIFLLFIIQRAIEARFSDSTSYKDVRDPEPLVSPPIPPCEDKNFITFPCYDFVWSGSQSPKIGQIVNGIMANNPGRSIPSSKVLSFRTRDEVDDWLFKNPMRCPGALHFVERNASVISYGIQTNSTPVANRGVFEDPTFTFQIPLQLAAEREIARSLIGDPNFSWVVSLKEFAHPAFEVFSALRTIGPTFFLAVAMFGFVFQINALIIEKELKLRQAMTMMGLYDTAYWLSWFTWEGFITLLSSLFTVLFGMMFQFDFFLNNNFAVVFLLFFLFQLNMVGFAYMVSAFISKSSSTTTVGFFIFIIGFMTQLVTAFGFPYSENFSKSYRIIWSLFPPNLLAQGLQLLAGATATPEDPGVSWSGRTKCAFNDTECVITMNEIYIWLVSTFFLWFVLAIYLDNTIPNISGVRKSAFYFLNPGFWTGKSGNKVKEGSVCSCTGSVPALDSIIPDDEDVLEEENIVKRQAMQGEVDSNVAVQLHGLVKIFPGTTKMGCCKCQRKSPFHAIKGLWVNLAKDQLFCLLGPNGAGKTTTINCLTGITPVTAGDALIYGESIRSSAGMSNIRSMIGVCPQFDILWDALSGQEHLHIFASIKGLPPGLIKEVVEKSLAEVKLTQAARMRAGSYSGGMKRRLSVAIALIGEPKLVILDEPTTGMDPITRRHVWDIIEDAKKGRAIILTTHSMEEADILSDRIGIMAKGRLRCIGTSIRLKSRFGTGFIANVSFSGGTNGTPDREDTLSTSQPEAVKQFFKSRLDVVPTEENKSFLTFIIPHAKEKLLTDFFAELQDRDKEFGISDIQLGLTTLEEVFLNIARQAELEDVAEGSSATLTLNTGHSLQIPIGARFVKIPGTESAENPIGTMVEVYWDQDDSGRLCISGHSPDMPIPAHVQLRDPPTDTSSRGFLRKRKQIQGTVIDPAQITGATNAKRSSSATKLLRYPLRSGTKTKEEKPPLTDASNSSVPRRGKPASSVSKSISVLDLGKERSAAKPPRRLSIQSKSSASPASRAVGTITPISEARAKRSVINQGKTNTPLSALAKSSTGKESNRLSSALYWLSQIKLSESAAKHSISLGFFKLALEAGCEPLQRLRDELKSYVQRHSLLDLGEPVQQLFESYNISHDFEQLQVSETCSHAPQDGTPSSDDEVHSSSSVAGTEKSEPEVVTKDAIETWQVAEPTKETSSRKDVATKNHKTVSKIATTPNSTEVAATPKSTEVSGTIKKKLENPKQRPNKNKAKRQGNKSAGVEGPANAGTAEISLPEDKENMDAPQSEV